MLAVAMHGSAKLQMVHRGDRGGVLNSYKKPDIQSVVRLLKKCFTVGLCCLFDILAYFVFIFERTFTIFTKLKN